MRMIPIFSQTKRLKVSKISEKAHDIDNLPQTITENNMLSTINVSSDIINCCLEVLAWRFKTFLPISKPIDYAISIISDQKPEIRQFLSNRFHDRFQIKLDYGQFLQRQAQNFIKEHPKEASYQLIVKMETIKFRLNDIQLLPLPQITYLIKEMMIGYEVLIDIFGIFEPKEDMIIINSQDQWKLWINSFLQSHQTTNINITLKEFIYKLLLIAQKHCLITKNSKNLFVQLKQLTYKQECSFIKILQKIKVFEYQHKIFQTNKVIIARKEYFSTPQLTKKKGYSKIQQMRSSLVGGKFIPKEDLHRQKNVSLHDKYEEYSENTPQRMFTHQNQKLNLDKKDQIDPGTNNIELNNYQFYTPRERVQSVQTQLFTPQMQSIMLPKKHLTSIFASPRLNTSIANSKIQTRRRTQKLEYCDKSKFQVDQINENEQICQINNVLSRQKALTNLKDVDSNQNQENTFYYKNSISTDERKEHSENWECKAIYRMMKQNDLGFKFRNNQSTYMDFSLPSEQKTDKNLSASFQFTSQNEPSSGNNSQLNFFQQSHRKIWKNTISGLFSQTTTIRQLKTSIKIKSISQKQDQRKYLSDINLEILSKMGRTARESLDLQQGSYITQLNELKNLKQSQIINEQKNYLKDSQEQSILIKQKYNVNWNEIKQKILSNQVKFQF